SNNSLVSGFAEASDADMFIGIPLDIDFYFGTSYNVNPWQFAYPNAGNPNIFSFLCPDHFYQAEIVIPEDLILTNIQYFPDPNLPANVNITVPPVDNQNNENHYTFALEDLNGGNVFQPEGRITGTFLMA